MREKSNFRAAPTGVANRQPSRARGNREDMRPLGVRRILLALLVSTAACGPVTTEDARMPALRTTWVTRMQQKADEAFGSARAAGPIFRARVATCVEQLPVGCVRAIEYYLSPSPYSMSDIQEMIKADEDPTDFLENNDPSLQIRGPGRCEFGFRGCMTEADPSGELKWYWNWECTDCVIADYAAGYGDGYEDGHSRPDARGGPGSGRDLPRGRSALAAWEGRVMTTAPLEPARLPPFSHQHGRFT